MDHALTVVSRPMNGFQQLQPAKGTGLAFSRKYAGERGLLCACGASLLVLALVAGCGEKRPFPAPRVPLAEPTTRPEQDQFAPEPPAPVFPATLPTTRADTGPVATMPGPSEPTVVTAPQIPSPATLPAATLPAIIPSITAISTTAPVVSAPPMSATRPATALSASPDAVEAKLYEQVKVQPDNLRAIIDDGLLRLAQGKPMLRRVELAGLAADDRQITEALFEGLGAFRGQLMPASANANKRLMPLLEMGQKLQALAPLRVSTVAVCKKVDWFGVYEPLDAQKLYQDRFVLYCEVTGFQSRLADRGMWETRLMEQYTLSDDMGNVVLENQPTLFVDASRSRRHDFFTARIVRLTKPITPGDYTLRVRLTDQLSSKSAQASIAVRIVEPPAPQP